MRYSLMFKVKGDMQWVFSNDYSAILTVCASFKLCHVPFCLYDHRTIILETIPE